MKIVYIYTALVTVGGADRVIINKANWLANHGYDVHIVTDTQKGRVPVYPLSSKVTLYDLNIDFSKEYGHILPIRIFYYFVLMRKYKKKLEDYLKKEKPDVVITTLGRDLDFLTNIKDGSIKLGESHIVRLYSRNFHLMEQKGGLYKLLARYGRWKQEKTVSQLDGLVLLTEQDRASWKEVTRTFVIPNPLTFSTVEYSKCENKQAICVGRYNEQKGYEYLIDAWAIVNSRHPDWTLHAYGAGEMKDYLQKVISENGLINKIILHEPVSNIVDKYLESSLYILSSRYEGFAMVLIEAMECGVPCVSFDCPSGPSDIISHGEDGYLVDYLNSRQLAERICELIENDELRKEMGHKAKINVQRYEEDVIMKQWENLFNMLIQFKKDNKDKSKGIY